MYGIIIIIHKLFHMDIIRNILETRLEVYLLFFVFLMLFFLFWFFQKSGVTKISHGKTPTLDMYAKDLTKLAIEGKLDPVVGRNAEIERVIQILSRRNKNNPVLVGRSGVGKTAIAEGLAQEIVKGGVPKPLRGKRVLALDLPSIVAGTKYRGEFEQRLKRVADEITASQRDIILFIDEIHTLAEAGEAAGAIGADDILKPALARGDLQVVGATTKDEYLKFIKKDATLDRRLHPILVDEPTPQETLEILHGIKHKYEDYHKVKISDEAINEAVDICVKNIKNKAFPDKAIDLIDEGSSMLSLAKVEGLIDEDIPVLKAKHIREIYREMQDEKI